MVSCIHACRTILITLEGRNNICLNNNRLYQISHKKWIVNSCEGIIPSQWGKEKVLEGSKRSFCSSSILNHPNKNEFRGVLPILDDTNSEIEKLEEHEKLVASELGLDPMSNRFHQPIVYHEHYSFADWPESHTFPMDKFERLAHALLTTCRKTMPKESTLSRPIIRETSHFFRPLDASRIPRAWIAQPTGPISPRFVDDFVTGALSKEEARYIGFREQTSRPELIERTVLEVAGTVLSSQLACKYGISTNAAGGTHHAHQDGGAGYTIINDLAVAANFLTNPKLNGHTITNVKRVLVIDCDVHQGDGTAKIAKHSLNDKLFTLSIHCASNYPHLKANSTYDVGLPDGTGDEEYLRVLKDNVNHAMEEVRPDFVLYDAGVDIYEHDRLGRFKVSEKGIRLRDRWVLERCVSAGIPVTGVIGGGYDKNVDRLARRHAIVHEEAAYVWRKYKLWEKSGLFHDHSTPLSDK